MRNLVFAMSAVLFVCGGCGDVEPVGNSVSGTVTFQGKPLDQGSIEFAPAASQDTMTGAPITNGQYSVSAENGLKPGPYQVRITSSTGGQASTDAMPGEVTEVPKQRIPSQFNSQTTLKADVTESGENRFDFDIP